MPQPSRKKARLPRSPHNPETKASASAYQTYRRVVSASSNSSGTGTINESAQTGEKRKGYKARRKDFLRKFEKSLRYAQDLHILGHTVLTPEELVPYQGTHDHNKRQELIDIMEKYILTGKSHDSIWIFDVDDYAMRRGGPLPDWKGQTATEQALKNANFKFLHFGTSYGYRMNNGKKELVFAVRFNPYKYMSGENVDRVRHLATHFNNTFRFFNWIKTNGPHKQGGLQGDFAAEGWTAGYEKYFRNYRVQKAVSVYKSNRMGKDRAAWEAQKREVARHTGDEEMKFVSGYYEEAFERLCPTARKENLEWMSENQMPQFGAKIYNPIDHIDEVSASNLTVTRGDFSNVVHCDKDASPFSFGIWFLTKNGDIVLDEQTSQNAVKGGQFFLPQFKIAIDFGKCTGTVEMMWRGQYDLHATARSTSEAGFSRIGTSIQGARRLLQKVQATGDAVLKRQAQAQERAKQQEKKAGGSKGG